MKLINFVTFVILALVGTAAAAESDPETVLVRYHVRAGKSGELANLIDRTWDAYRRLGLVFDRPHIVMRGEEKGGEFLAEIVPWKSHSAPDNAPSEVHALWDEIEKLCERRGDRNAVEIPEVDVLKNDS